MDSLQQIRRSDCVAQMLSRRGEHIARQSELQDRFSGVPKDVDRVARLRECLRTGASLEVGEADGDFFGIQGAGDHAFTPVASRVPPRGLR
jgi:hypothetical protein